MFALVKYNKAGQISAGIRKSPETGEFYPVSIDEAPPACFSFKQVQQVKKLFRGFKIVSFQTIVNLMIK